MVKEKDKFKDWHLYIGAKYVMRYHDYAPDQFTVPVELTLHRLHMLLSDASVAEIKLVLRRSVDMNREENETWRNLEGADAFRYLLSIGIDLFGLIEAGLAIDKKTL